MSVLPSYRTNSDDVSGYVYYGLRYYSPSMGRFVTKDPIEEQGGLNLYAFCSNNGVNRFDVLGRDAFMIIGENPGGNPMWFQGDGMDSQDRYNQGVANGNSGANSMGIQQDMADALNNVTQTMGANLASTSADKRQDAFNWLGLGTDNGLALTATNNADGSIKSYRIDDIRNGGNIFAADLHQLAPAFSDIRLDGSSSGLITAPNSGLLAGAAPGTGSGATSSGGLTMTVVQAPTQLADGKYVYKVQWGVPAGQSGYVVQHVSFTTSMTDVKGNPTTAGWPSPDWYEAWKVTGGTFPTSSGIDTYPTPAPPAGTKGTIVVDGHVTFIPNYTLNTVLPT